MSSKKSVPDAWDDDWVNQADNPSTQPGESATSSVKLSKAARRAQQAELNKKLWDEAEAPNGSYFLDTRNDVPLRSELKPAVKVLSRKPAPKVARPEGFTGTEKPSLQAGAVDEDDDDDDENEAKEKPLTAEERQAKAKRELEEKQRKYEEARERLFGTASPAPGTSSPGTTTPPRSSSANIASRGFGEKGKGRGRGAGLRDGRDRRDSRPSSSSRASTSTTAAPNTKQLYDPNYTPKPESYHARRKESENLRDANMGGSTPVEESQIIRTPRGPDGSGRGGFGFVRRGGSSKTDFK